ncbi:MAG: DUF3795 domain-containing protein [Bacteroidales bacterium]|nr:DUF3795 domain-containing protein [Bacteroidales bacterium]
MPTTPANYEGMIAPCGMNCGLCIGHLREKKSCGGCFKIDDPNKPAHCRSCSMVNCEFLAATSSGFCYECKIFPCTRLKNLDKRYRTKYGMSMLENLESIRRDGLEQFIIHELIRWKCPHCGAGLSVHRDFCLVCKTEIVRRSN